MLTDNTANTAAEQDYYTCGTCGSYTEQEQHTCRLCDPGNFDEVGEPLPAAAVGAAEPVGESCEHCGGPVVPSYRYCGPDGRVTCSPRCRDAVFMLSSWPSLIAERNNLSQQRDELRSALAELQLQVETAFDERVINARRGVPSESFREAERQARELLARIPEGK